MSLHGTPSHVELAGDLGIVASLQKQFDNLLFARPQPNSLILHQLPLFVVLCFPWPGEQHGSFPILIASSLPFSMLMRRIRPEADFAQALADKFLHFRYSESCHRKSGSLVICPSVSGGVRQSTRQALSGPVEMIGCLPAPPHLPARPASAEI